MAKALSRWHRGRIGGRDKVSRFLVSDAKEKDVINPFFRVAFVLIFAENGFVSRFSGSWPHLAGHSDC
jgi:hypothetical protein